MTGRLTWLGSAVILLTSACLFLLAGYILADTVYGVDFAADVGVTLESFSFSGVAIWGIATILGLLRSRPWGRISAVWLGRALFVVFLPEVAWYAYLVKTTPDIGWSWQPLYGLIPFIGAGSLLIFLFSNARAADESPACTRGGNGAVSPTGP